MSCLVHFHCLLAASSLLLGTFAHAQVVGSPEYNPTVTTAPISIFTTTTESLFSTSTISEAPTYTAPSCPLPDNSPYADSAGGSYTVRCPADWSAGIVTYDAVESFDACMVRCTTYTLANCGAAVWFSDNGECNLKYSVAEGGELLPGNGAVGVRVVNTASSSTSSTSRVTQNAPVNIETASSMSSLSFSAVPDTSTQAASSSVAGAPPAYSAPPGSCTGQGPTGSQSTLTGEKYTISCSSRTINGTVYSTSTVANGYVDCFAQCDYQSSCNGFTFTGQDSQSGAGPGTCELIETTYDPSNPTDENILYFVTAGRGTVGGVRGPAVLVGGPTTTAVAGPTSTPASFSSAAGTPTVSSSQPPIYVTPVPVSTSAISPATSGGVSLATSSGSFPGTSSGTTPGTSSGSSSSAQGSVVIVTPIPATTRASGTSTSMGESVIIVSPIPATLSETASSSGAESVVIVTPMPATPSGSSNGISPASMSLSSYFDEAALTMRQCMPRACSAVSSVCSRVTTVIAVSAQPSAGAYIVGGLMG